MYEDVASLLSETLTDQNQVKCQYCGTSCDKGAKVCSVCGEPPVLITLGELGMVLPIGIVSTKTLDDKRVERTLMKDFEVCVVDFNIEREISRSWGMLQKRSSTSPLDFIVNVLVHTVTKLAGSNFSRLSYDRKFHALSQMYMGDVMYMYCYLRVLSVGDEFTFTNITCPNCRKNMETYTVDLSSIEVETIDDLDNLECDVKLDKGIELDGEVRKVIKIRPATFYALSKTNNDDAIKAACDVIRNTIVEIPGTRAGTTLLEEDFDKMSREDFQILEDAIDYHMNGPKWFVEVVCDKCNFEWDNIIDWRYTGFFKTLSRLKKPRRQLRIY